MFGGYRAKRAVIEVRSNWAGVAAQGPSSPVPPGSSPSRVSATPSYRQGPRSREDNCSHSCVRSCWNEPISFCCAAVIPGVSGCIAASSEGARLYLGGSRPPSCWMSLFSAVRRKKRKAN